MLQVFFVKMTNTEVYTSDYSLDVGVVIKRGWFEWISPKIKEIRMWKEVP